ncbi:MAG: ATP-binding protein [Candidatus Competibacter sp.]|nr:AAA family ATPase [Candidatus Competibacteraceae bacterium]
MKIQVQNLGVLKQAEFSLGEMTIICGCNNTGKTYATYALFGFLSYWREMFSIHINESQINDLLSEGVVHIGVSEYAKRASDILLDGCNAYRKQLPTVFAAPAARFKNTEFQVNLDLSKINLVNQYSRSISSANSELFSISKNEGSTDLIVTLIGDQGKTRIPKNIVAQVISNALKDIIFGNLFPDPFIASAERTGAAIFRKELNFARNRLLEEMSHSDNKVDPIDLLFKVYQDYALPVKVNVDFTRQIENISKEVSFIGENHSSLLNDFADIIGGEYAVTRNDELYYIPKNNKRLKLSMDESSSAVRSLLDIGFYLKHVAKVGDLLMVDEPELNLHPENQRRVARLFAQLVNLGIKVFITTHSDYIIKELNTLIMLNGKKTHLQQIADREGYRQKELLSHEKIKVYIAEESLVKLNGGNRRTRCQTLMPANIDLELGIEVRSFDKTIEIMNRIQEEIVWGDSNV